MATAMKAGERRRVGLVDAELVRKALEAPGA